MSFFTLIVWIGLAALAIRIAGNKGRGSGGFTVIALLLPIVGLIVAVAMAADQGTLQERAIDKGDLVRCHACKTPIHPEATICPHCQTKIESFRIGSLR